MGWQRGHLTSLSPQTLWLCAQGVQKGREDQNFEWEHFKASGPPMAMGCLAGCRVSSWQGDGLVNRKGKWPVALGAPARSQRDALRCLSFPAMQLDGCPERLTLHRALELEKLPPVCGKGAGLGAT